MYIYTIVSIHNDMHPDSKFVTIDENYCYFNDYSSDYLIFDDEKNIIKSFSNPKLFDEILKDMYNNDGILHKKYKLTYIYLKEKIENNDFIKYIEDTNNDYLISDEDAIVLKYFNNGQIIGNIPNDKKRKKTIKNRLFQ